MGSDFERVIVAKMIPVFTFTVLVLVRNDRKIYGARIITDRIEIVVISVLKDFTLFVVRGSSRLLRFALVRDVVVIADPNEAVDEGGIVVVIGGIVLNLDGLVEIVILLFINGDLFAVLIVTNLVARMD